MPDRGAWPFPTSDPYPAYRAARERAPVSWDERLGAHLVLDHEHAAAVLRGHQWSSDPRSSPQLLAALGGLQAGTRLLGESLLLSDPPAHTRLRGAVNRFFTPHAVQAIRARVAAIAHSAFAPLAEGEPVELMGELAHPISLAVISELFDVGLEGAELLRVETPMLARMLELDPKPAEIEMIGAAAMSVMLFLVPLVAQRRTDPGGDLLSALIHPPDGGVALRTEEIVTMCLLLLAAGHHTTANLIGNGALALLEHPEQLQWLARHPDGAAQAVQELLRYDAPVQVLTRVAREDLVLGDVTVRRGQPALVVLGAANRDPARHPEPDRLDLTRNGPPHLSFGNGPHYCLGAGLARLEAQETFTRMARWWTTRATPTAWAYERDDSRTLRRLRSLHIGDGRVGQPVPVTPVRGVDAPARPSDALAA
ncbi:MAG TPA: cytochrome P450 [Solirubrobacteraceae bacterium]|nr:cytochrome P450 [Solirubrobacteraceae bacterium]